MATTNEAYWAARIAELEKNWNRKSREQLEKELARYYNQALKHIQKDIEALYGRFAKDNSLSYADAVKTLTTSEYKAWRMDIEDYLKQYKGTGDKELLKELNILAMKSRISRLDKLYSETLTHLADLSSKTEKATDKFHTEAYKDFYYHGIYETGKKIGFKVPVSVVDDKDALQVLRTPWSGKNYSQRIWTNNAKLSRTLKQTITQAVHRGTDIETLSRLVSQKMNTGISNARRLVRTELNYTENHAALDSIKDSGMKYYRFTATLDRRTSIQCREHDGRVYKVEEYSPGTNAPPLHPNCRSTISGSLRGPGSIKTGTRIARADNGKTYHIPADMNYQDWKAVYVDKTVSLDEWKKQQIFDKIKLEERYRHTSRKEKIEPISEKRFWELVVPLQKRGALIQRGGAVVEAHLAKFHAEASTIGTALFFSKKVSLSGVLEEMYHFEQNLRGLNDDKKADLRLILNEIDAKKYLLKVRDKYQIPRLENELTRNQLKQYEKMLTEYREKGET